MRISSMAMSEVDAVGKLAKDCGFHVDMVQESARSFAHVWVARLDSESKSPDAFLLAWQAADAMDIIALGTACASRRLGLAKALVTELLQFSVNNQMRHLLLEVRSSNTVAIQLYQAFGFQAGRIREAYYSEPTEDGIEMSCAVDNLVCAKSAADARNLETRV
jgi:ribosomal protein S18 acetylase RimI-like enzyme